MSIEVGKQRELSIQEIVWMIRIIGIKNLMEALNIEPPMHESLSIQTQGK